MKKVIGLILSFIMIVSVFGCLVACGDEKTENIWLVNAAAPTENDKANVGDFWLDSSTSDIYLYTANGWNRTGSFKKSSNAGSVWYKGEGEPSSAIGQRDDYYLDTLNKIVYRRKAAEWSLVCFLENDSTTVYINNSYSPDWYEDKTLKILAVGNSFSIDTLDFVYEMAQSVGIIEHVVIGNLYIGGCSLKKHLDTLNSDSIYERYYIEDSRTNVSKTHYNYNARDAISSEDWDFISFQQNSGNSGVASTYTTYLGALMDLVLGLCPNATPIWNMTWAYQQDCENSAFSTYSWNQLTMYNAIIEAVKAVIVPNSRFAAIVPNGTAIQNARTSSFGDTLTKDGYHLTESIGRYIAGLTYFCKITGLPPSMVSYKPSSMTVADVSIAKEAVKLALEKPFEISSMIATA